MANITGHRGKDMSTILQAEEGKENGRPPRPSAGQRRKKRRRLNDLDSDSTVDEEESEEEFCLSERYGRRRNRRSIPSSVTDVYISAPLQLGGGVRGVGERDGGRDRRGVQQQRLRQQQQRQASHVFAEQERTAAAAAELQEAAETEGVFGR